MNFLYLTEKKCFSIYHLRGQIQMQWWCYMYIWTTPNLVLGKALAEASLTSARLANCVSYTRIDSPCASRAHVLTLMILVCGRLKFDPQRGQTNLCLLIIFIIFDTTSFSDSFFCVFCPRSRFCFSRLTFLPR